MILSIKPVFLFLVVSAVILRVAGPCNCGKNVCDSDYRGVTPGINFKLKNQNTGADILMYTGSLQPAPDSIKLKNAATGQFYSLFISLGVNESLVRSNEYIRPPNTVDSLIFYFGSSIPDTLVVRNGLVDSWRGDECPTVKDADITKVTLRNQVLFDSTAGDAVFTLRK
ncbi:MAG TPA: hypothetical protein VFI06_00345 [Chitinophagaceae bacterium]|nr:hypothetical protein [Chitinophagaceae bacterium]